MTKFRDLFEAKMTKGKVDKLIKAFGKDNDANGEDRIDDLYQAAEIFLDDEEGVMNFLNDNGFDPTDYVASRL